jgi:hypothetical protein
MIRKATVAFSAGWLAWRTICPQRYDEGREIDLYVQKCEIDNLVMLQKMKSSEGSS